MMLRIFAAAALGLAAACGATAPADRAAPAPAPKFERIVAFGDSYVDNGNIFRAFGVKPPALYPKGRFSDGLNYVDVMGSALRVPVVNFGLGGAVAGSGRGNDPAGFETEWKAFVAGGGPAAFPRVSGRFGARDLVVVSIGGNDARAFEKSFGAAPTEAQVAAAIAAAPAAADASVAAASRGLDALAAAGARTNSFLGGDVGRLPEAKGRPLARIGSAFSARYNQGMKAALARLATRGVAVHYLDLDALADRVEANPAAFGLASAGACPQACLGNPALARRYLFYVDRIHPTEAGYRIVARAALSQLAAKG
jgi:phospholipase/lecithinase/hemolysin